MAFTNVGQKSAVAKIPTVDQANILPFPELTKAIDAALAILPNHPSPDLFRQQISKLIDILEQKLSAPPEKPIAPVFPAPPQIPEAPPKPVLNYTPSLKFIELDRNLTEQCREIENQMHGAGKMRRKLLRRQLGDLNSRKTRQLHQLQMQESTPEAVAEFNQRTRDYADWSRTVQKLNESFHRQTSDLKSRYKSAVRNWELKIDSWRAATALPLRIIKHRREALVTRPLPGIAPEKLPWRFLPPGETEEERLRDAVRAYGRRNPEIVIDERRILYAYSFSPEHVYIGEEEFDGYFAFIFPYTSRVLLENPIEGNAAYIFDTDWRTLSKLTKTELLHEYPHKVTRIFHTGSWEERLRLYFFRKSQRQA